MSPDFKPASYLPSSIHQLYIYSTNLSFSTLLWNVKMQKLIFFQNTVLLVLFALWFDLERRLNISSSNFHKVSVSRTKTDRSWLNFRQLQVSAIGSHLWQFSYWRFMKAQCYRLLVLQDAQPRGGRGKMEVSRRTTWWQDTHTDTPSPHWQYKPFPSYRYATSGSSPPTQLAWY